MVICYLAVRIRQMTQYATVATAALILFYLYLVMLMLVLFGLFAIRRADATNYAMFDPDVCGAKV